MHAMLDCHVVVLASGELCEPLEERTHGNIVDSGWNRRRARLSVFVCLLLERPLLAGTGHFAIIQKDVNPVRDSDLKYYCRLLW